MRNWSRPLVAMFFTNRIRIIYLIEGHLVIISIYMAIGFRGEDL